MHHAFGVRKIERARNLESVSAAKNELIARLAVELEKPVRDTREVVSDLEPAAASLRDDETVGQPAEFFLRSRIASTPAVFS